ncbi:MAG: PepSY domain-containing protein [Clostridiales bacterium]|nr:PepSY domain-containing protein [Clostridiales bacterium]
MKKRTAFGIIILLVLIILFLLGRDYYAHHHIPKGGQAQTSTSQEAASQGSQNGSGTQTDQNAQSQTANSGLEQAKETALAHAGLTSEGVTFIKAKKSKDDGKTEYEIEFVTADTKYDYEIDADTYNITDVEFEPVEQTGRYETAQGIISPEDAKSAALTALNLQAENAVLVKIELDFDDGSYEYDVEYFDGGVVCSCEINAANGEVVKIERETVKG